MKKRLQSRGLTVRGAKLIAYSQPTVGWECTYPHGSRADNHRFSATIETVPTAEKLYISLMPGTYTDLEPLIEKAGTHLRIVSPCWVVFRYLWVRKASTWRSGEVVFRGLHVELGGNLGIQVPPGGRFRLHDLISTNVDGGLGLLSSGSDTVWISNSVFKGLETSAFLNATSSRLDGVWFDDVQGRALVIVGDSSQERTSGPARSLVGNVVNGVRIDFGAESALGIDYIYASASIEDLHLGDYEAPLGAGLRLTDSIATVKNLKSVAPVSPCVEVADSVLSIRDSVISNAR